MKDQFKLEAILGIKGNGFVMLASNTMSVKKMMMLQDGISKLHRLTDQSMLAIVGDDGYSLQFMNYILRGLAMYEVSNGYSLSPKGVVHFTRTRFSGFKRRLASHELAMLIGGFDPISGPELHFLDSNGAATPIPFGGYGSGAECCESLFQELYKPNLRQEAAYNVLKSCVAQILKRYAICSHNFDVSLIDKDGIKKLEAINTPYPEPHT